MRHRLAFFSVIFCCGIIASQLCNISFRLIYPLAAALAFLVGALRKRNKLTEILLLCLVFLIGAAALKNSQILPACHIAKIASQRSGASIIRGIIKNEPTEELGRISFILAAKEIQLNKLRKRCCGDILVFLRSKKDLRYGDELLLRTFLLQPSGRGRYRQYLGNQGIFFLTRPANEAEFVCLSRNNGFAIKRFSLRLKERIERVLALQLSGLTASIMNAMLLGDKRNIPNTVYKSMMQTGTVHILVVSGFNVGIVALCVMLVLKLLRVPRRIRFLICASLLFIYCLMTGASNPVVRATIMAVVFMFAYFFKREPDIYNSLSVAALFILALNPRQLFDIGFQLSFVSVISIACIYPKIRALFRMEALNLRIVKAIAEASLVSLSAWIGTMGFIAYYFRIFSPITVIANIFIVPLASLITLCGLSLLSMKILLPPLAHYFALTCELLVLALLKLNSFLAQLPSAYLRLP